MDNVLSALNRLSCADLTHDEWVRVGMGLKAEGYDLSVWDDWSRQDPARYHPGDCQRRWDSFHGSGNPVTGATIVRMAQDRGWIPFTGTDGWRQMCDWDGIDVVYNVTNWSNHAPVALYAMKAGKHVFIEVPAAMTLDECWELVETSEATKRHCMQLENCCYGEEEMLGYNLVRKGLLGEIVHGECAYIHDLRASCYRPEAEGGYWKLWRLEWNTAHKGNQYTTHGLGPIAQYMDINRGDRFDYLVSLESNQANCEAYAKAAFGANSPQAARRVQMGDMNTTLIKTAMGRSIMLQHDVSSPRPYTRHNLVTGTKGIFYGMVNTDMLNNANFGANLTEPPTDATDDFTGAIWYALAEDSLVEDSSHTVSWRAPALVSAKGVEVLDVFDLNGKWLGRIRSLGEFNPSDCRFLLKKANFPAGMYFVRNSGTHRVIRVNLGEF